MSTRPGDQLYQIFEQRLYSGDFDDQPTEALLNDVVDRFWELIDGFTAIPLHMHENVRNDLLEDVRDMLRLKIYGHVGIGEYNEKKRKK